MKIDQKQQKFFSDYYNKENSENYPDYRISDYKQIRDKKILVVGVGMGRDVEFLVKGNDVYGIDISSEGNLFARKKGIKTLTYNFENRRLPYDNNLFDIVVCKDVFEHMINPRKLLNEIKRVLKNNGELVLNVPNHFYLWHRLRILFGGSMLWNVVGQNHSKMFKQWDYMHVRYFTWSGINEFLNLEGFYIAKRYWDFGTLAYYNHPDFVCFILKNKQNKSVFEKIVLALLPISWKLFNIVFPLSIRSSIVSLSPGLFCANFYLRVRKDGRNVE